MSQSSRHHSLPVFEGKASRRHRAVPLRRLRLTARLARVTGHGARSETRTMVQFAGFPRSGHSIVGSLIDSHPDALVAHELDLMGLLGHGMPLRDALALAHRNSAAFQAHGRYWNGYSYAVPGDWGGRARRRLVVGDKKGDWAVRHYQNDPLVLDRLARQAPPACRWILVLRNPFDNIATMALRVGRVYDQLRIAHPDSAAFRTALAERQGRDVPAAVEDAVIDDYAGLLAGVAQLRAAVGPEAWTDLVYEDFAAAPADHLARLADFLGLPPDPAWQESAAGIVRAGGGRSRDRIAWRPDQVERVMEMIEEAEILAPYRGTERPA